MVYVFAGLLILLAFAVFIVFIDDIIPLDEEESGQAWTYEVFPDQPHC